MDRFLLNMFRISLFLIGTAFLVKSCNAYTLEWEELTPESQNAINLFYSAKRLRPFEEKHYIAKRDEHYKLGRKHAEQVFLACWYCPRIDEQAKARMCYTSIWSTLGSSEPKLALIIGVGSLLMQYGLECMREWNFIQTNLYQAQHHFEMYEFYDNIIDNY